MMLSISFCKTPLHLAVQREQIEIIKFLLGQDIIDVNAEDAIHILI